MIWTSARPTSTPAEVSASVRRWAASPSSAGDSWALACRERTVETTEVGEHREAHHGDADAEPLDLGADDQPVGRLVDDDPGADQDQHPLDRRRQALDLLVAVGVVGVGRLVGFADRDEGDDRGDQVDQRVDRLGDDRDRAGDRPGGQLDRDQERVGGDRERRRAALGADHRPPPPPPAPRCAASMPRGAAAVADRVLLGRAQLGHRALVVGAGVVGDEGRVVAEAAARRARSLDQPALAARLEDVLGAVRVDQGQRADVGGAAVAAGGGDLAQQLVQVLLVAGALAAVAGRVDPGRAAERRRPRSRSRRRSPPRRSPRARPAPCQRVRGEAVAVLGRQLEPRPAAAPARPPAAVRASRAACACCRWRRSSRPLPAPAPPAGGRSPPRRGRAARRARRARAASARPSPAPRPGRRRRSSRRWRRPRRSSPRSSRGRRAPGRRPCRR